MATSLKNLNELQRDEFVRVCGPFFEHSPWIAERTFARRPFASRHALHVVLCDTVRSASIEEQAKLIAAHPDLVGRLAREGKLTCESTAEQAAAGLTALTDSEIHQFERYNAAYREKFGFPFVICARENKRAAILSAFPTRLKNSRQQEIHAALEQIFKIARLRLLDAISDDQAGEGSDRWES